MGKILHIKIRWAIADIRRSLWHASFRTIDWIEKRLLIWFCMVRGLYRYLFFFRVGGVYKNNYNHFYYKYTGDCTFLEGNRTIDTGYIAVQLEGKNVMFNILAMGLFDWKRLQ